MFVGTMALGNAESLNSVGNDRTYNQSWLMMLSENIPQMYKIRVTDGLPKNDCHTSTMTLFLVWEVGIVQFTGLSTFNREETLTSNQTLQYFGANPSPTSPII